jgi:hypothetical protein
MEKALHALTCLPGCVGVAPLSNASLVGAVPTGFVATFSKGASVECGMLRRHLLGGTSIYKINNDQSDGCLLPKLQLLGKSVSDESTQAYSLLAADKRVWKAAMIGNDAYIKIAKHVDPVEHATSWYIVVRSQLPVVDREFETIFGGMTYAQMIVSDSWQIYKSAATRNRNRLAASVATALGLLVDMHADATNMFEGAPINVAVPCGETLINGWYEDGDTSVSLYAGCTNTAECGKGIMISPSANTEVWLHGDPVSGVDMRGGPFSNDIQNAFPTSTGIENAKAMPDERERAKISERITWANSMAVNSSAIRGRFKAMDASWYAAAARNLGWEYSWGSIVLETVLCKIAPDNDTAMTLHMLLELNETRRDITLSMRNAAVHSLIDNLAAVKIVMEAADESASMPTLAQMMLGAEDGVVCIPTAVLVSLNTVTCSK